MVKMQGQFVLSFHTATEMLLNTEIEATQNLEPSLGSLIITDTKLN